MSEMNGIFPKNVLASGGFLRTFCREAGLIATGCLIYVIAMNAIMVPSRIFSGGLGGIALILTYRIPSLDLGLTYLLLNLPLLVVGGLVFKRSFLIYTVFGIFFFSWAASYLKFPPVGIHHPFWAATATAVICGIGNGLILRSAGSAGGLDVIAIYFNRRLGLRTGTCASFMNAAVVIFGGFLFDPKIVCYSIYFLLSSGIVTNIVVGMHPQKVPQVHPQFVRSGLPSPLNPKLCVGRHI